MRTRFDATWRLLRPYLLPRLPLLGLVLLLGLLTSAAQAAGLALFLPVWDYVLFPEAEGAPADPSGAGGVLAAGDADGTAAAFSRALLELAERAGAFDDPRLAVLMAVTVLAVILALVAGLTQLGFTWYARKVSYLTIVDLRVDLARHLMGLSLRYHGERRFGDLLSRVSSDVTTTLGTVNVGLRSLILMPLMALGSLGLAATSAPLPTLGVVLILPALLIPVSRLASRVRKGSKKSLTSLGDSVQALTQVFQGIRTVKSFGGEERELERYRELNKGYLRSSMKMVRAIALTHGWTAFFSVAGVAVLVLALGWLNLRFELFETGGTFGLFFLAIARLNNQLNSLAKALTKVEESAGAAERIQDLLDEPVDVLESPSPRPVAGLGAGIRLEDVSFEYAGSDKPALAGIDLEILPGETLALVGPSGSGKSTLVDLLARFVDPTAGRITVDGHDLRELAVADWTRLCGMVGQVPFLFHASIGENIAYGKPGATRAEIEEAARVADIADFIASLPAGYDTDVADMGTRLSGGQRQRITIARAVLKGAPLLLLDEATSALDSQSEAEVQRALERLMADRTVVVIAHRLSTVRDADRICVLEEGRIVELGTHAELIAGGGTYARLSSLQDLGGSVDAGGGATRGAALAESSR